MRLRLCFESLWMCLPRGPVDGGPGLLSRYSNKEEDWRPEPFSAESSFRRTMMA